MEEMAEMCRLICGESLRAQRLLHRLSCGLESDDSAGIAKGLGVTYRVFL